MKKKATKLMEKESGVTDNSFIFEIGEEVFISKYDKMFVMVDIERERLARIKVDKCNYAMLKSEDDNKTVEIYNHNG